MRFIRNCTVLSEGLPVIPGESFGQTLASVQKGHHIVAFSESSTLSPIIEDEPHFRDLRHRTLYAVPAKKQ